MLTERFLFTLSQKFHRSLKSGGARHWIGTITLKSGGATAARHHRQLRHWQSKYFAFSATKIYPTWRRLKLAGASIPPWSNEAKPLHFPSYFWSSIEKWILFPPTFMWSAPFSTPPPWFSNEASCFIVNIEWTPLPNSEDFRRFTHPTVSGIIRYTLVNKRRQKWKKDLRTE